MDKEASTERDQRAKKDTAGNANSSPNTKQNRVSPHPVPCSSPGGGDPLRTVRLDPCPSRPDVVIIPSKRPLDKADSAWAVHGSSFSSAKGKGRLDHRSRYASGASQSPLFKWRFVIHSATTLLYSCVHLLVAAILSVHPYNAVSLRVFESRTNVEPRHQYPVVVLLFWITWAVTLGFYMVVSWSNPGYADEPMPGSKPHSGSHHIGNKLPNQIFTSGVCKTCGNLKFLRSKHCHYCGHCIRRFDHHCPFVIQWVANCIGQGNHRSFIIYVSCQIVFFLMSMALACESIARKPEKPWFIAPSVLLILCVPFLIFTIMLLAMHLNYIDHNCTTYEVLRGFQLPHMAKNRLVENPYDAGDIKLNRTHFWKEMTSTIYSIPVRYRLLEGNPADSFV